MKVAAGRCGLESEEDIGGFGCAVCLLREWCRCVVKEDAPVARETCLKVRM